MLPATAYDLPAGHSLTLVIDTVDPLYYDENAPNGSVTNVRIIKSTPRGVFDRTVESTVGRWRFQPIDAPRDVTQTFTFAQ